MKKIIKLKDLTIKQWNYYRQYICPKMKCENCPLEKALCSEAVEDGSWINNKDLYSDKFLNQEIEIEVPDILTKEEKEYLSAVIKPFKNHVVHITKENDSKNESHDNLLLVIRLKELDMRTPMIPLFKNEKGEYAFEGMRMHLKYLLSDLGLDD